MVWSIAGANLTSTTSVRSMKGERRWRDLPTGTGRFVGNWRVISGLPVIHQEKALPLGRIRRVHFPRCVEIPGLNEVVAFGNCRERPITLTFVKRFLQRCC